MSNLLNLIPPIRRHRMHKIRVLLDPVYEAKSKELDEFRGKLLKWTIEYFYRVEFFLMLSFWTSLVVFIWKTSILFVLIYPLISIICSFLVSVPIYLSFRKELKMDD